MDPLRERIVSYFQTKDKILPIVEGILANTMSIHNIPVEYTEHEKELIKEQVTIWENRQKYDNNKDITESALNFYMENRKQRHPFDLQIAVAAISGVNVNIIRTELRIAEKAGTTYRFNRRVRPSATSLTYKQADQLSSELDHQFFPFAPCCCRICYLLKLSTFAYEFVKKYDYPYPLKWDRDGVHFKFLQDFEMLFYKEISRFYKMNCIL